MNEFVNWATLGSYGGALAMVMVLTQFTKELWFTKMIPTQLWSYILSFFVLMCAVIFNGQLSPDTFTQTLFNAVIVSIGANGGFGAILRISGKNTDHNKEGR